MDTTTQTPMIPAELYGGALDGHLCEVSLKPGCMGMWIFEFRRPGLIERHAYEMMPRTTKEGRWVLRWNCCVSRQRMGGVA